MYKVTVRHQRLPGIGDRFDLEAAGLAALLVGVQDELVVVAT